jgi:F-type H+-transporting ATPase subunit b
MAIISSAYAAQDASQETNPAEGGAENAGAAGSLAHGGAHESAFPPFDATNFAPQLIWLILIFGVLYLLMSRLALPRVAKILSTRETTIGADLDAARELQSKAQAADGQNNATLRAKKDEAQAIGREAQEKIAAEIGASRTVAEKKFAEEIAAAEARIAAEKTRAMANVEGIATEAAAAIIAKLTGAQVDGAKLSAAYRDAVKERRP